MALLLFKYLNVKCIVLSNWVHIAPAKIGTMSEGFRSTAQSDADASPAGDYPDVQWDPAFRP